MRPDIRPGGIFPDYALPDHTGAVRRLSELQGRDPLILTLARGNYCPKEHQQHLELAANYPKIAVAYTQIATIARWLPFHNWPRRFRMPARSATGEIEALSMWAGQGVALARESQSAADIVAELTSRL